MSNLHIRVQRADFVRELSMANACVSKKTTIPILGNVLLRADGDLLYITGTDLEMGLVTTCPAKIAEGGSITLPAKRLADYVKLLPEGEIEIKVDDKQWAAFKSGKSRTRIPGMAADSFPELPQAPEPVFQVKGSDFEQLVHRTAYAISQEESRFTLNGALLKVSGGQIVFVATDGHRLAMASKPCESASEHRVLIPRRSMIEVSRLVGLSPVEASISVSLDDNHLFFSIAGRSFVARRLTGSFPDYERVLPKDLPNSFTFNRAEMVAALGRIRGFADERSRAIRLHATAGEGVVVKASLSESGESEESIDATVAEQLISGYNANYLIDTLNSTQGESFVLSYKDGHGAVKLSPLGDDSTLAVLMPMRI